MAVGTQYIASLQSKTLFGKGTIYRALQLFHRQILAEDIGIGNTGRTMPLHDLPFTLLLLEDNRQPKRERRAILQAQLNLPSAPADVAIAVGLKVAHVDRKHAHFL